MNLDAMGVDYSIEHAATLASQLPLSARVHAPDNTNGLNLFESLLVLLEYNTRFSCWLYSGAASSEDAEGPKPLFGFLNEEPSEEHKTVDELKEFLARKREVIPNE